MTNKTFNQFVTEAAKRGRPRKLRPGEEADTLHIQDQLSKLTHPNHVELHFKDGSKHNIPREHANKALQHLSSLKPIDRADHAEHMGKGHSEFYHVLTKKSIPDKKPKITLAGPKLRKEEAEIEEDYEKDAADWSKKYADNEKFYRSQAKSKVSLVSRISPEYSKEKTKEADRSKAISKKYAKQAVTGMREEAENDDGWYAHKEMHGSKAVSKEDWKKGVRLNKDGKRVQMKKEEVEQVDEASKEGLQRYVQAAKPERHDPMKGEKRKKGINLALKKIIGSDTIGRKPKVKATNEEVEYSVELLEEIYEALSEEGKALFEKMSSDQLAKMVSVYHSKGGKITKGKYNQPRESEKPFPASKMKGSKWASTASSVARKNQGYKK